MNSLIEELLNVEQVLNAFVDRATRPEVLAPLQALEKSANEVGRAWSGSWIGYQANVYYENLQPPPPGAHFSSEWGFYDALSSGSTGEWREFDSNSLINLIKDRAGQPDITYAENLAVEGNDLFGDQRDHVLSILEVNRLQHQDAFLDDIFEQTKHLKIYSSTDYAKSIGPAQINSRDSLAISQGARIPPHITVLSHVVSLQESINTNKRLSKLAQKAATHMKRIDQDYASMKISGNHVFIGHGHSLLWKDLKDFLHERLKLQWDEFNRVPIAGISNVSRLSEMLDSASIAFLVMTAEDEQSDGKIHARANVIHEAGLFQGKLGFNKAIVLLEDGCEEFSNIQGLGQIHFPKGNIKASFEEIRATLEREGILDS